MSPAPRPPSSQLRAAGVPVCIDDFGAGNAAFRYLRDFVVDFVKIDGSYVQGAVRSAQERSFVAAMVQLARSVGARVVAEMIETEAQATLMGELQVEFGQGWLFGRPGKLGGGGEADTAARSRRRLAPHPTPAIGRWVPLFRTPLGRLLERGSPGD